MASAYWRTASPLILALALAACGGSGGKDEGKKSEPVEAHAKSGAIVLSENQIATAGIEIVRPVIGTNGGAIELPATIDGDPQGTQVVSASVGGRVVALNRNVGQTVGRGTVLAVIESREVAALKGEVEAARARAVLARSNLAREQRLFTEKVSPEQDLVAARTAAAEAEIALRQASQQLSATGGGGGSLNRVGITSPIAGEVIGRTAVLGQTVAADAELFRVANLSRLSLSLSLSPADAARVRSGAAVEVKAGGRTGWANVRFVSPVLNPQTRLVPVIASIDNRAGNWRVGEAVTAAIELHGGTDSSVRVPLTAIQTVEGKPVVFVRTAEGFKAVTVLLGAQAEDFVIVRSGLTGREQIAGANSFTLKSELGKGAGGDND